MTHWARVALLIILGICGAGVTGTAQVKQPEHDQLEVLAHFLRIVYPDLADQQNGLASLQIYFGNGAFNRGEINFDFRPCRMSGVSTEKKLRYCGETPPVGEKPFLASGIRFGRYNDHDVIAAFNASGTFVDGALEDVRGQFKDRSFTKDNLHDKRHYWTDDDALQALKSKNPKYGPDHKKELLATLPVAVFVDLTGCRLRPDSAEFVVAVLKDQPPELKWHVGGDVNDPRLSKTTGCSTTFEPFEGRLTSFSMEPKAD